MKKIERQLNGRRSMATKTINNQLKQISLTQLQIEVVCLAVTALGMLQLKKHNWGQMTERELRERIAFLEKIRNRLKPGQTADADRWNGLVERTAGLHSGNSHRERVPTDFSCPSILVITAGAHRSRQEMT